MATLGGGGGIGRGRDDEGGKGDGSNKRPKLVEVISLVDSSDEDEAGVADVKPASAAATAAGKGGGSSSSGAAASLAAAASSWQGQGARVGPATGNPNGGLAGGGGRSELPVLPFYLGRVERIPEQYNAHALSIRDVFEGNYHKAVLSNYMYEWEWLLEQVPALWTLPCLAVFGDNTGGIANSVPTIETFKPAIKSKFRWGTHHSKFALLFAEGRRGVRVMITTANFIQIDWENKTEGVFVQDFPFLPANAPDDASDFGKDLRDYLAQLDAWENESTHQPPHGPRKGHARLKEAIQELRRVDFSAAQALLVASVPGVHAGGAKEKYGHMRLRRLLEQEDIPPDVFLPPPATDGGGEFVGGIVSQFSSMDGAWVKTEFEETLARARRPRLPTEDQYTRMRSHVVWPRLADVSGSLEGLAAGGALPCRPGNVHLNEQQFHQGRLATCHPYLRQRLSRFVAGRWGRGRAMPHFKSFLRYALHVEPNGNGGGATTIVPRLAWCLVTSHNFSKSAWGVLQKKGEQLRIESFELGVLFLPSKYQRFARAFSLTPDHPLLGLRSAAHTRVVDGVRGFYSASCEDMRRPLTGLLPLPIPYALPPPPYAADDVPWSSPLH